MAWKLDWLMGCQFYAKFVPISSPWEYEEVITKENAKNITNFITNGLQIDLTMNVIDAISTT